jgi:hypothetical protein
MKKVAFILVVAFVAILVFSSCSRETCPAYSQADTEQTDRGV